MTAVSDMLSNDSDVAAHIMPLDAAVYTLIPLADGPVDTVPGFRAWRAAFDDLLRRAEVFASEIPSLIYRRFGSEKDLDALEARATLEEWASNYVGAAGASVQTVKARMTAAI
jgi:hypothetical protein